MALLFIVGKAAVARQMKAQLFNSHTSTSLRNHRKTYFRVLR